MAIDAVLDRLEGALGAVDGERARRLAPGLADAAIDSLVEPLGLTLPGELRTLWAWHDGFRSDALERIYPFLEFPSLARAVDETMLQRTLSDEIRDDLGFEAFPASWLSTFLRPTGDQLACECGDHAGRAPVHPFSWEGASADPEPFTPSLEQLVTYWIDMYESGGVATTDGLLVRRGDVPPDRRWRPEVL